MNRLESGVVRPAQEWCDVRELLQSAIEIERESIDGHEVRLTVADDLPLALLDHTLIEQAVAKLHRQRRQSFARARCRSKSTPSFREAGCSSRSAIAGAGFDRRIGRAALRQILSRRRSQNRRARPRPVHRARIRGGARRPAHRRESRRRRRALPAQPARAHCRRREPRDARHETEPRRPHHRRRKADSPSSPARPRARRLPGFRSGNRPGRPRRNRLSPAGDRPARSRVARHGRRESPARACANGPTCRSSSSPCATTPKRKSRRSMPAPTIT